MSGELFTKEEHSDCIEFYQKLLDQENLNVNEWANAMYYKYKRIRVPHSYRDCLCNISALRKEKNLPIIEVLGPSWNHYNITQLVPLAKKFWKLN